MNTKKLLSIIPFILLMSGMSMNASAVLPPKYLSIENFQQCLANKNMGTWTAWCKPAQKPADCQDSSWQQLNNLTGKDKLQDC